MQLWLMLLLASRAVSFVARESRAYRPSRAPTQQRHKDVPRYLRPSLSQDSWEKWEFGDERFIDEKSTKVPEGTPVTKGGAVAYDEALAALAPFVSDERRAKMAEVVAQRSANVRFVLENPTNPSNAWACLRTLDSFGIQSVDVIADPAFYMDMSPLNPRYQRMQTAVGAQKWLDLTQYDSTLKCIERLKVRGFKILVTDLSPGAVPLTDIDFDALGPFVVALGNEERGITEEMRALADHKVYLPMRGFAQSFSLSVGCAAISSHLNSCGAIRPGTLSATERSRVLFNWYMDTVRGGEHIVRRAGLEVVPVTSPGKPKVLGYQVTK